MKLLAFDTSTELISIAVSRDDAGVPHILEHTGAGGAQASSALIPTIETLMAEADLGFGELDAILFGRGPGSFTGLRTACSVAQGLGFGARVPLLPVDTLLAVAEEARMRYAGTEQQLSLLALLDARMGELYAASYEFADGQWHQGGDFALIKPEQLRPSGAQALAGNVFAEYADRLPVSQETPCWQALPTASAMLRLAPALLAQGNAVAAQDALPHYIRDKVALTTQERAAVKSSPA